MIEPHRAVEYKNHTQTIKPKKPQIDEALDNYLLYSLRHLNKQFGCIQLGKVTEMVYPNAK